MEERSARLRGSLEVPGNHIPGNLPYPGESPLGLLWKVLVRIGEFCCTVIQFSSPECPPGG